MITEVGGTVGDIEILPFLEAIRQFRKDVGRDNVFYVHVTLVPFIGPSGEQKTKPTQHSVTELRSRGIQPDAIVCRSDRPIPTRLKEKISPALRRARGGHRLRGRRRHPLRDPARAPRRGPRRLRVPGAAPRRARARPHRVARRSSTGCAAADDDVRIGLVGKYINLPDAYLSVVEALKHGGYACGAKVEIDWIASDDTEGLLAEGRLHDLDGIVVPGGFGFRGIEGKIAAAGLRPRATASRSSACASGCTARSSSSRATCAASPARTRASSTRTRPHPVIDLMDEQSDVVDMGGTMRLGAYPAKLAAGHASCATIYGEEVVYERHRHRYEVNNRYRQALEEHGHGAARAPRPTTCSSSSSSCRRRRTRSSSRRRRTRSSRAGRTVRTRCSPRS